MCVNALVNENQVRAVTRLHWALPLAWLQSDEARSKLISECFLHFGERNVCELALEEEWVTERATFGLWARLAKLCEETNLIELKVCTVQLWIQIDLWKTEGRLRLVNFQMGLQEPL